MEKEVISNFLKGFFKSFIDRNINDTMKKQLVLAKSDFSRAIELKPEASIGYKWRGFAYLFTKKTLNLAINDLEKAICIDPENEKLIYLLAKAKAL